MTYKTYKHDTYTVYTIATNKFKSCQIMVTFSHEATKENMNKDYLLTQLLTYTSKKYPKRRQVVEKQEDLYTALIYPFQSRIGNLKYSSIIMEFLDPKYTEENYLKEVITFLGEMIQNPLITNDEFDRESFKVIQNKRLAQAETFQDDKTNYAVKRAHQLTDETTLTSWNLKESMDEIKKLTPEDLATYYHEFMKNSTMDIFVLGNLDMEEVNELLDQTILKDNLVIKEKLVPTKWNFKRGIQSFEEIDEVEQCTLVDLFDISSLTEEEKEAPLSVWNYILGGGALTSKLGKLVREENSLCYSISSYKELGDQLLMIYAGIDSQNDKKVQKLIATCLKEMQKGSITKEEIDKAKKSIQESIQSNLDNQGAILDNALYHETVGFPTFKEYSALIDKVSLEDLIRIGKKIKWKTSYVMKKGEPHGKN